MDIGQINPSLEKIILKSLEHNINENGYYGNIQITEEQDVLDIFWTLVMAAGFAAKMNMALSEAGKPYICGGCYWDPRKKIPKPGFNLQIKMFGYNDDDYYEYSEGQDFAATIKGLKKSLFVAEQIKERRQVLETTLQVSWLDFLPGETSKYIKPLFEWRKKQQ
ncbi:MAG: hypothetical protein ACI9BF_000288 [Candidatus Paceibacteria bacterium]|jgi:hypothetical protein